MYRVKRKFEKGSFPAETTLGKLKKKTRRSRGGGMKTRLLGATHANISNPSTGKTQKVEILRVIRNPANVDYDRRGVITKGTVIETPMGTARVTCRPGQKGAVNAVLVPKKS
jgi:small subunit ribosomal protein S8e